MDFRIASVKSLATAEFQKLVVVEERVRGRIANRFW